MYNVRMYIRLSVYVFIYIDVCVCVCVCTCVCARVCVCVCVCEYRACSACTNVHGPNTEYVSAAPPGSRNCSVGCRAGFTEDGLGTSSCASCPPGRYKAGAGHGACILCEAGKFSAMAGASACSVCRSSCPAGWVLSGGCGLGSQLDAPCSLCPAGKYKDAGSTSCE